MRMLEALDKKLDQVDAALCAKLAEEESRAKKFQVQQKNSLDWLKLFHEQMAVQARDMMRQQLIEQARQGKEALA